MHRGPEQTRANREDWLNLLVDSHRLSNFTWLADSTFAWTGPRAGRSLVRLNT